MRLCYNLPTELRYLIYGYLTHQSNISPREEDSDRTCPLLRLRYSFSTALLLLSRQITAECNEFVRYRNGLLIECRSPISTTNKFLFRESFNHAILKRVKDVQIICYWSHLMEPAFHDRAERWTEEHTLEQLRYQQNMDWSPSKGNYGRLL